MRNRDYIVLGLLLWLLWKHPQEDTSVHITVTEPGFPPTVPGIPPTGETLPPWSEQP